MSALRTSLLLFACAVSLAAQQPKAVQKAADGSNAITESLVIGAGKTLTTTGNGSIAATTAPASGISGVVSGANGGTGVANAGKTLTLSGNVAYSGAYNFSPTLTGNTTVTFPTNGTLVGSNDSGTVTNTMLAGSITNAKLASGGNVTIAGSVLSLGGTLTQDQITGLASTGLVKRTAANTLAIAASGTDYAPTTSGSSILYGNGAGGFSNATVGSGLTFSAGTLSGNVTSVAGRTGAVTIAQADVSGLTTSDSPTFASVKHAGTAGTGYSEFAAQSVAPSAPTGGFREFADSSGRKSWIRASDGFIRTWDATLTASRVYTLQDTSGTVLLTTNGNNTTVTNLDSITGTALANVTITGGSSGASLTLGQGASGNAAFNRSISASNFTPNPTPFTFKPLVFANPALSYSDATKDVKDPALYVDASSLFLFYSFGRDAGSPLSTWNVAYATTSSNRQYDFTQQGIAIPAGSSGTFDEGGAFSPTAPILVSGTYYMWYTCKSASQTNGPWNVALATATSLSGAWSKGGLVIDGTVSGHTLDPWIVPASQSPDGKYRMYVSQAGGSWGRTVVLYIASSPSGPWTRYGTVFDPSIQISGTWATNDDVENPAVMKYGLLWYLFVDEAQKGIVHVAYSTDGLSFTETDGGKISEVGALGSWDVDTVDAFGPFLSTNGQLMTMYQAHGEQNSWQLGVAMLSRDGVLPNEQLSRKVISSGRGGDPTFVLQDNVLSAHHALSLGYNLGSDYGYIDSKLFPSTAKQLQINTSGGSVLIGGPTTISSGLTAGASNAISTIQGQDFSTPAVDKEVLAVKVAGSNTALLVGGSDVTPGTWLRSDQGGTVKPLTLNATTVTTSGNATVTGNLTVSGNGTQAISGATTISIDNADGLNDNNSYLRVAGFTTPAKVLRIGYDTTNGYGVIQALQGGVGYKPIKINPNGGDITLGANVTITGNASVNVYLKYTPVTVAGLGNATTAGNGATAYATDLTSTTSGSTATGGGSGKHLVTSDGTNWIVQ